MGEQNKRQLRIGTSFLLSAGILLGSAAAPFGSIGSLRTEASVVNYETTANLNMRQSASTSAGIILTIPKGEQVTYVSESGAWFKVKYGSKEGWVSSSYLKKTAASTETTTDTSLSDSATTKGEKVLTIPKGKEVIYLAKQGDRYKVQYGNRTAWVSADQIKVSPKPGEKPTPPVVVVNKNWITTATTLNMRDSSSTAGKVIAAIPKGTILTSISEKDGWYEVSYEGKKGYVSAAYLYELTKENAEKIVALEKKPYILMDLRTRSSVTANQINQYLVNYGKVTPENSVLHNTGQLFIDAANKYGLNALYLAAHAIHESNFGKSQISKAKNNLFGFGAYDLVPFVGATKFDSVASNIDHIAQEMKATYLNPSNWKHQGTFLGYTIKDEKGARIPALSKGMNFYYASDSNWGNAIASHMERILPSSQETAFQQQPNTQVPSSPGYPAGKDIFPAGTLAVANAAVALYDAKGGSTATATIQKGETFNLLEKWNDYWLTIQYNGQTYYTNKVSFNSYNQFFTVKNLARVNADVLNVRDAASTSGAIIGTLPNYQYVELVMDSTLAPIVNNGWYNIKLNEDTIGWVSGEYLIRELNR
ncbi:MAG: SH3 domain-containing protein [Lysinibacillus sp.]